MNEQAIPDLMQQDLIVRQIRRARVENDFGAQNIDHRRPTLLAPRPRLARAKSRIRLKNTRIQTCARKSGPTGTTSSIFASVIVTWRRRSPGIPVLWRKINSIPSWKTHEHLGSGMSTNRDNPILNRSVRENHHFLEVPLSLGATPIEFVLLPLLVIFSLLGLFLPYRKLFPGT